MNLPFKSQSGVSVSCSPNDTKGFIAIYKKGESATTKLRRSQSILSPGIPVQLTEESAEIRDGSDGFPIKLPALQKHIGEAIPALIGMLPDGTLVKWDFGYFLGRKKLILEGGQVRFTNDFTSDLFDQTICEADCTEVAGAMGFKQVLHSCPGAPDKLVYQMCLIPKCCCAAGDFPDLICEDEDCLSLVG